MANTYVPRGTAEASAIMGKSKRFLTYYDPDGDGGCAGELSMRLLEKHNQEVSWHINENRTHGLRLTDAQLQNLADKEYTILLVDAGVTLEELKRVVSFGVSIIVIDHHELEYKDLVHIRSDTNPAIEGLIINNQYPFEPEEYRFLSGAGVAYYVYKAIAPNTMGQEEKALVGLSLLTDIRPLENPIAQSFLHVTYTLKTPYMQYLIDLVKPKFDFGFGIPVFDRNYIDFTFSPRINALFRLNKGDEAVEVFRGNYTNHGQLDQYRALQTKIIDEMLDVATKTEYGSLLYVEVAKYPLLEVDASINNFVGLACSKVKNQGKTSILVVTENGKVERGSVRGMVDGVDYLNLFRKHGFEVEGHKPAFGVMAYDADKVDWEALSADIEELEREHSRTKYDGRVFVTDDFTEFMEKQCRQVAEYNNYVREDYRYYVQYTGTLVFTSVKGKCTTYTVEGHDVKSFDSKQKMSNSFILPVLERGYIQLYMKTM